MRVGVFDSGLGGLTVLARLRPALPRADLLYFADQAHVPYGDRGLADLHAILERNLAVLRDRGAAAIVMGCNTSCAVAGRLGWPPSPVPVFDLIAAGAAAAVASGARRVAVVATAATVALGAYRAAIGALDPGVAVEEVAAPELVPLIEGGAPREACAAAVRAVMARVVAPCDGVVMGCSHFSLLRDLFAAAAPGAALIDPAAAQAARVAAALGEVPGDGTTAAWTNGDADAFARAAGRLAVDGLAVAPAGVVFGAPPRAPSPAST